MRNSNNKTVIMSAFTLSTVGSNLVRHKNLQNDLKVMGLSYKVVTGVYKGSKELSLVIPCNDAQIVELLALSKHYNQECIAVIDKDNQTNLLYPNGDSLKIGTFKHVTKEYAESKEAYTLDEKTGFYFIAE